MTQLEEYQAIRIEALEAEVLRLNNSLIEIKLIVSNTNVSKPVFTRPYNPDFDKKISDVGLNGFLLGLSGDFDV